MKKIVTITAKVVLSLVGFCSLSCGLGEEVSESSTAKSYDFASDINPILTKSCAGNTTCHGNGESGSLYVGQESAFKANAVLAMENLRSSNEAVQMPKPGYGISLSAGDKDTLLEYLTSRSK